MVRGLQDRQPGAAEEAEPAGLAGDADGDTLLRAADAAMYRVKQTTKGGFVMASPARVEVG